MSLAGLLRSRTENTSLGVLPVEFRRRVSTAGSTMLFGADPNGVLEVVAKVKSDSLSLVLDLRFGRDSSVLPRDLLSVFRFLRTLRRPAQLTLTIGDDLVGEAMQIEGNVEFPRALVDVVRSLAFVQALAGTEFPAPAELGKDDLRELEEAETLLTAGTVSSRWSEAQLGTTDTRWLEAVQDSGEFTLDFVAPAVAQIAGHEIPLGEANYTFHAALIHEASTRDAVLRSGSDDRFEIVLLDPPEIGLDLQDLRPPIIVSAEVLEQIRQHPLRLDAFISPEG